MSTALHLVTYSEPESAAGQQMEATLADIRHGRLKQTVWLFQLAGRLKNLVEPERWQDPDVATRLAPVAWQFAQRLAQEKLLTGKMRIDWTDRDAVEIEWMNAWHQRRKAVGPHPLEVAYEAALGNPLQLADNRYLVLIVNMGHALQERDPERPFMLPVNDRVAALLGVTVMTLCTAVTMAIRKGYFEVVDPNYSAAGHKARLFRFRNPAITAHEAPTETVEEKLKNVCSLAALELMEQKRERLAGIALSGRMIQLRGDRLTVQLDYCGSPLGFWPGMGMTAETVLATPEAEMVARLTQFICDQGRSRRIEPDG